MFRTRGQKRQLLAMLSQEHQEWRSLGALSSHIGETDERTRELLIQVGARGSVKAEAPVELWGLVSRVGLP